MLFFSFALNLLAVASALLPLVSAGPESSHLLIERENDDLDPRATPIHELEARQRNGGGRKKTTTRRRRPVKTTTKKAAATTTKKAATTTKGGVAIQTVANPPAQVTASAAPSVIATTAATASVVETSVAAPVQTPVNGGGTPGTPGGDFGAGGDPQTSLIVDPAVINENFKNNGQDPPVAGQVASLTSSNNFVNFCLTQNVPLTNGQQIKDGSCNQAPMGRILSIQKIPTSKFIFPTNLGVVKAQSAFTIQMQINNMVTGQFTNAQKSYFAAPAQVDASGTLLGHSHVVVEKIESFESTKLLNVLDFAFFKGFNNPADANGVLTADVPASGLAVGFYRMSSINSAANHQPALIAVAQHGTSDDTVYFQVTADGLPSVAGPVAPADPAATDSAAAAPAATGSAAASQAPKVRRRIDLTRKHGHH